MSGMTRGMTRDTDGSTVTFDEDLVDVLQSVHRLRPGWFPKEIRWGWVMGGEQEHYPENETVIALVIQAVEAEVLEVSPFAYCQALTERDPEDADDPLAGQAFCVCIPEVYELVGPCVYGPTKLQTWLKARDTVRNK